MVKFEAVLEAAAATFTSSFARKLLIFEAHLKQFVVVKSAAESESKVQIC